MVKWASPLWRLLVNHDRRRIRSCCHPLNSLSSVSSSSVFCGDSTTYLYMSYVFYADNTISTWVLCLVLTALSLHKRYILCWQHYLYMSSVFLCWQHYLYISSTISTCLFLCFVLTALARSAATDQSPSEWDRQAPLRQCEALREDPIPPEFPSQGTDSYIYIEGPTNQLTLY